MMASLRGNTTLFSGDLDADDASNWAYVGSGTDVTLFIDDGGGSANWLIEVAVGSGSAGLNGVDLLDDAGSPSGVLSDRTGAARTIATTGTPIALSLSPFAAQYIRVRPDADVTGGSARINVVSRNSRSLRGHQVLWNDEDVSTDDTSPVGFIGDETNAVLFLVTGDAGDSFDIQVAPSTGAAGLNETPDESSWAVLYDDGGDQVSFQAAVGTNTAIDLSPFGGSFVRLKANQDSTGVTATVAVTD